MTTCQISINDLLGFQFIIHNLDSRHVARDGAKGTNFLYTYIQHMYVPALPHVIRKALKKYFQPSTPGLSFLPTAPMILFETLGALSNVID